MNIAILRRTGALGLVAALSLGATTVTYTYTGNDFTTAYDLYNQSDYVSAQLDFANPLAANLNLVDITGQLIGWSMTDQVQDYSSVLGSELQFTVVSTDSNGNIDQWQVVSCDQIVDCTNSTNTVATYDLPATVTDVGVTANNPTGTHGLNSGDPGTWLETQGIATPEPSSAVLLMCGAAVWAGWKRRYPGRGAL